jgi:hypothetical protein
MKKQTLIFASLVLGLAAVPGYTQTGGVKAKVPFSFAVAGKVFASGEYTMTIRPHQLKIEDEYGRPLAFALANDASGPSAGQQGQIVFRCYRDRCFLAEVWATAQEHGLEFPLSRSEAEFAKEQRGTFFAVMGEKLKP